MRIQSVFWLFLGLLSLGLAILGVVTPILPTTPLVLLAAFCFAKSSPRLHQWMLEHKTFGSMIINWRDRGAIPLRAKIYASISIAIAFLISIALGLPHWVLLLQAGILCLVLAFIWTRPSQ